jgi:hypothetical protein
MRRGVLAIACVAIVAACGDPFSPGSQDYIIKVDSVAGPGAVSGGAPFTVYVYGFVGGNGCHQFKEFQVDRSAGAADITVVGHREGGTGTLCTQNIVMLDGEPLTISPPITDPFLLRFHQPDKTILTKTIRAE